MGRFLLGAILLSLMPGVAAAQGESSPEWFVGYQQVPGVTRPLRGAVVGLVMHRKSVTSGVLTVSGFRDSRSETFANDDLRTETTTAMHLGAGGRWHRVDGRVRFFAQAQALLALSLDSTTVRSAANYGGLVEVDRTSSIIPLVQGGFGVTIMASRHIGVGGSAELSMPVTSPGVESLYYRASVGVVLMMGGTN
jgi:hypothetical protein